MKTLHLLLWFFVILADFKLRAEQVAPEKALKYHEALVKNPHNATVFSRFYDAWIDVDSVESLEKFLTERAETAGGIHYSILARHQLRRGKDADALISLNEAIEATPSDPALFLERANLLSRSLDFAAARKDWESVVALGNEALAIEASKLIGKSHLREGKPEKAIQVWETLLGAHPGNEELLEDLIELAASSEQSAQALMYSEKLIAATADPYNKALRLIRRGELLSAAGKSDEALSVWTETLTQTGEGSWLEREILAHIERFFRRFDRLDLYETKLEELARAHPRRLLVHRELAKREAASGKVDSAIGRFREVLRRSPGEEELREEFIRLLIQSERFDDASAELGKMLTATPDNAELHLRLADLNYQKSQTIADRDAAASNAEILKSLERALELLDPGEASGLRIAQLMIRYGLGERGEALLLKLSAQPGASSAPAEALAAEYVRTKRADKALGVLSELAKSPDVETVIRATAGMAPLAKPETAFEILHSRLAEFENNRAYLTAFIQASLAAKKPAHAMPSALRLVRTGRLGTEIQDAVQLAKITVTAAEKSPDVIAGLSALESRSTPETCLLAALLDAQKEYGKSDALFQNSSDPILIRFHSSLLTARGDFKSAIVALNQLAGSAVEAGASYFKELSDLQLRAGDSQACLKTLDQWKTAAPTDKTPWVIATRLLREAARQAEAIESARRALSRFPNDEDLTGQLAELLQQSGEHAEAERMYWKLYDQAPDPTTQSRWAARLATLARMMNRVPELKENFLQRARGNRQSIGPVLALVELARANHDEKEAIDFLYQALRTKPNDLEIRLQAASAEKQFGNPDKQISILTEGLAHDVGGRLHAALAQAYIDQGDVLKGMHMLRALQGDKAKDPRIVESAAISMANTGMIAEAIQYISDSLPDGMDWRARFLLASLLERDGRELEAADHYLKLRHENADLPGVTPSQQAWQVPRQMRYGNLVATQEISQVMQWIRKTAYERQNSTRDVDFKSMLLTMPAEVRARSKVCLANLANMNIPALSEKLDKSGIPDISFIKDAVTSFGESDFNYAQLLKKHPDNHELIFYLLYQGYNFDDPNLSNISFTDVVSRLMAKPGIDDNTRIFLIQSALQRDPSRREFWEEIVTLSERVMSLDSAPINEGAAESLFMLLKAHKAKNVIPAELLPRMRSVILGYAQRTLSSKAKQDEHMKRMLEYGLMMQIHALFGEVEPWIKMANSRVSLHREKMDEYVANIVKQWSVQNQHGIHIEKRQEGIPIYGLPITSLPFDLLHGINPARGKLHDVSFSNSRMNALELIPHLDKVESPLYRAWIAIQSGDEEVIRKAMDAKMPAIEADDFRILEAYSKIQNDKPVQNGRLLLGLAESFSGKSWVVQWAQINFLSTCLQLTPEQRKEFDPAAREILQSYWPPDKAMMKPEDMNIMQSVYQAANKLGFGDIYPADGVAIETQKFYSSWKAQQSSASGGAAASTPGIASSPPPPKPRPVTAMDRYQKYSNEGKYRAAAHELLLWTKRQRQSGYEMERTLSEAKTPAEVKKEIFAIMDPGSDPGVTKRMDYVDICQALGEPERALSILRTLAKERPFDLRVTTNLAFLLPPQEIEHAADLLKDAVGSRELFTSMEKMRRRLQSSRNSDQVFAFHDVMARFLEVADPIPYDKQGHARSVNSMLYYFFNGSYLQNVSSIFSNDESVKKDNPVIVRHRELSQKITRAMQRHPALMEFAFRVKRSAGWVDEASQVDEQARNCLLIASTLLPYEYREDGDLLQFSSAQWICDRIKNEVPQETLLPPEFLSAVAKNQPSFSKFLIALYQTKNVRDIDALWESGLMTSKESQIEPMATLKQAMLDTICTIPGSADFFAARIAEWAKDGASDATANSSERNENLQLFMAALSSCENQSEKDIDEICSAIARAIYGKDANLGQVAKNEQAYEMIRNMTYNLKIGSVAAIRITRAFYANSIPMDKYLISKSMANARKMDSDQVIEWLDGIGFLKEVSEWRPLSHHAMESIQDPSGRSRGYRIERVNLEAEVLSRLDYKVRSQDFVTRLVGRQPRTFGTLATAAAIANLFDRKIASGLAVQAIQHAEKYLANASEERINDFLHVIIMMPYETRSVLPARLQGVLQARRQSKIVEMRSEIDAMFQSIVQSKNESVLRSLQSRIGELAAYDPEAAAGVFQRAYKHDSENRAAANPNEWNAHREVLFYLLRSIMYDKESPPSAAFRFYRLIRKGPESGRFGIGNHSSAGWYYKVLGEAMMERYSLEIPKETAYWFRPWIAANRITDEYHLDALIAAACVSSNSGYDMRMEQVDKLLQETKGLSPKTLEFIPLFRSVVMSEHASPKNAISPEGAFARILGDPGLDSDMRLQMAYCMVDANEKLLNIPDAASTFASIFIPYCAGDFSVVEPMTIRIVQGINELNPQGESLPYLKRINEAFWNNAKSPKLEAHAPIREWDAIRLFIASIHIGDYEMVKRNFPEIRPLLVGKMHVILPLIRNDQFEMAHQLLPEDIYSYADENYNSFTPDNHFAQKLDAFAEAAPDAVRALQYECMLIVDFRRIMGHEHAEFVKNRLPVLIERYRKHRPDTKSKRIELLAVLAADSYIAPSGFEDEIKELAAEIDVGKAVSEWMSELMKASQRRPRKGEYVNRFLTNAAMIRMLEGDASLFTEVSNSIVKVLETITVKNSIPARNFCAPMISDTVKAVAYAVAENRTGAFGGIIRPLREFTLASVSHTSSETALLSVTLYDFVTHWEDRPEDLSAELEKRLDQYKMPYIMDHVRAPRSEFAFIFELIRTGGRGQRNFGEDPEKFIKAILTRKSMAPLLKSDSSWLHCLRGENEKIPDRFIQTPPDGITPEGIIVLRHYQLFKMRKGQESIDRFRAFLNDLPPDPGWNHIRVQCKVRMVDSMIRQKQDLSEARAIMDSVDAAQVSKKNSTSYQQVLKRLKEAEDKVKKPE